MAIEQVMRASDADREHAVEALRGQFAEGRLTLEEFDERTSSAYAAKTWTDLRKLTIDLPVTLRFGEGSAPDVPGPAMPPMGWQRWPAASRAWLFVPLVPILFVGMVAASFGAWHHPRSDFPFFPVVPLTIFASIFVWRLLQYRAWRRHAAGQDRR